jgi:dolichol-phosphate mannosyltransferase
LPAAVASPRTTGPLVTFIIPIFNEVELVETVLQRVRALPLRMELILVDDCSTDGTTEILEKEKARPDTVVLRHNVNRGKGAAIRTGLTASRGDIVLIQDADLEYNPEEIPALIQPIVDGRGNVVYGSRFMGRVQKMKFPNRVANFLLAAFVTVVYGYRLSDEATAYKVFKGDLLRSIPLNCERFEFCPEITAKVLRRGEKIVEVPINYEARTFEEGKKIGWRDFVQAVYTLGRYRFWRG